MVSSPPSILIEFKNVGIQFGECVANRNVSFKVVSGQIHALVGENGAGKSTAMKILFGMYRRDQGDIFLNGHPIDFKNPLEATAKKIGMVHQHFVLAGTMSGLDHILLEEPHSGLISQLKPLRRKERSQNLESLAIKFKMPMNWLAPTENLSVGFQQRLEILKLLSKEAEILIFDEPTAVLTPQESEAFYQKILELKKSGKTVLLVTHKLKDVLKYSDAITVFRQGATVADLETAKTSMDELTELMVGRKLGERTAPGESTNLSKLPLLTLDKLRVETLGLKNVNISILGGEVLGVAGIEGNGQSGLIKYLLNPKIYSSEQGNYLFLKQEAMSLSTQDLRKEGLRYLPEDRLQQGSIPEMSLLENFYLGYQSLPLFHHSKSLFKNFWIDLKKLRWHLETAIKNFDVRPNFVDNIFSRLSGGNQQKLVVARELMENPSVLIAAQPTRGVDIGSIQRIHEEIFKLRNQGVAILLISSDLDELMTLSDRIVVMREGQTTKTWKRTEFDEFEIGHEMLGAPKGSLI